MDVSPALQALWDQQRRQITDNIRRYGVHLTYVSDHLTCRQGTPCVSCRVGGLDGERERIAPRCRADLVVADERMNVKQAWIGGEPPAPFFR